VKAKKLCRSFAIFKKNPTFFKKSQKKGKKGVDKRKLAWYYN